MAEEPGEVAERHTDPLQQFQCHSHYTSDGVESTKSESESSGFESESESFASESESLQKDSSPSP